MSANSPYASQFFFPVVLQPNVGHGLLIHEVYRSHNDASQLVRLLWMRDQCHRDLYLTTLTTDRNPCPGWDSNTRSQQANGRRPTPQTERPRGRAHASHNGLNVMGPVPLNCIKFIVTVQLLKQNRSKSKIGL